MLEVLRCGPGPWPGWLAAGAAALRSLGGLALSASFQGNMKLCLRGETVQILASSTVVWPLAPLAREALLLLLDLLLWVCAGPVRINCPGPFFSALLGMSLEGWVCAVLTGRVCFCVLAADKAADWLHASTLGLCCWELSRG